jgi:hypothetical protein
LLGVVGFSAAALAGNEAPPSYSVAAIRSFNKHQGDYLPAHAYKLYVDGALVGGFKDVKGLETDFTVRPSPDGSGYQPLTLVGGFIADPSALPPPDGSKAPAALHHYSIIHRDLAARTTQRLDFDGFAYAMNPRTAAFDVAVVDSLGVAVQSVVFRPHRGEVK